MPGPLHFLQTLLKPLLRLIVGMITIPLMRLCLRRIAPTRQIDEEFEKDITQWFRGSVLLLVATQNMESTLFPWAERFNSGDWVTLGFRVLLAISVVEGMPDQELFSIIHPGPPKFTFPRERGLSSLWREIRRQFRPWMRGLLCQHLNRSSPVFAILAAVAPGKVGWFCYAMAITQYLIIGLVTSRDKAFDVLSEFDRQIALRREQLVREFDVEQPAPAPAPEATASPTGLPNAPPISVAKPDQGGYVSE